MTNPPKQKPVLQQDEEGSYLLFSSADDTGKDRKLRIDFVHDDRYWRKLRGKNELLAKALGGAPASVYDLTLGLAEDAWTMARLGFQVLGCEREELLVKLLSSAHEIALQTESVKSVAERLQIRCSDSSDLLKDIVSGKVPRPDVIYIDPMFSGVAKKSALPRLEMQLMRSWLGPNADQDVDEAESGAELVNEAIRCANKRVVVKRLTKADELFPGVSHAFKGEKVRYDMYLARST